MRWSWFLESCSSCWWITSQIARQVPICGQVVAKNNIVFLHSVRSQMETSLGWSKFMFLQSSWHKWWNIWSGICTGKKETTRCYVFYVWEINNGNMCMYNCVFAFFIFYLYISLLKTTRKHALWSSERYFQMTQWRFPGHQQSSKNLNPFTR